MTLNELAAQGLRRAQKLANLSNAALAAELRTRTGRATLDDGTIGRWLEAKSPIPAEVLLAAAALAERSLEELLAEAEPTYRSPISRRLDMHQKVLENLVRREMGASRDSLVPMGDLLRQLRTVVK